MPRKTFTETVGDLRSRANLVKDLGKAALDAAGKLEPASLLTEVEGLSTADTAQESLKGTKVRRVGVKKATLAECLESASAALYMLKGTIKKAKKKELLEELPRIGAAKTENEKLGFLQAVLSFVAGHADVSGKIDPEDIEKIAVGLEDATTAGKLSRAAKTALPKATQGLQDSLRNTSIRTTAWLDILHGVFTLIDDEQSAGEVDAVRQEMDRERKEAVATPPGKPD